MGGNYRESTMGDKHKLNGGNMHGLGLANKL